MRKRSRRSGQTKKSRQVHFWVDAGLLEEFDRIAAGLGEPVPDAHRAALRSYVDHHIDEGSTFIAETELAWGREKICIRVFLRAPGELFLSVTGRPVLQLVGALRRLPREGDLKGFLLRALGGMGRKGRH